MARYTKIPVTVEAEQWTGENLLDICRLTGRCGGEIMGDNGTLKIKTLEGTMTVRPGDYIIKGVAGECYPCKPDIFAKTYCKAEDGPKFEPGQLVWVIERDEEGNAYGPSGYVFLAEVAHAAIVTPQINGRKDLDYNVDWHIRETRFSQATDGLSVFLLKDCYGDNDAAKAALAADKGEVKG